MSKKHLLVISHDVVGLEMAGPGIRYYHLARILARTIKTTLAIPQESQPGFSHPDFEVIYYDRCDWHSIADHYRAVQICLLPSDIAADFPAIGQDDTALIIDGYNPLMAEWLAQSHQFSLEEADIYWQQRMRHLCRQYRVGDFFICASERQRDWWLGLLEANGRLNPHNFQADPSLRSLLDVVPYGLPETAPIHNKAMIRGIWPNITENDHLLLWGGGLWPWLDALTAIQALAEIWKVRQDVKLVFPGTRHPNPHVAQVPSQTESAMALANQLGLLDKAVFFGDWVPYQEWTNVLLECDIALTLHHDTMETRLAFRSRVLEYIWAGLPIIATEGDATSELIEHYELGYLVQEGDVNAVRDAILHLLSAPSSRQPELLIKAQARLSWENVAAPLVQFCEIAQQAPDRTQTKIYRDYPYLLPEFDELQQQNQSLQQQNQSLQELVEGYRRGKFMRLMAWISRFWK